jgi:hypothetical protein
MWWAQKIQTCLNLTWPENLCLIYPWITPSLTFVCPGRNPCLVCTDSMKVPVLKSAVLSVLDLLLCVWVSTPVIVFFCSYPERKRKTGELARTGSWCLALILIQLKLLMTFNSSSPAVNYCAIKRGRWREIRLSYTVVQHSDLGGSVHQYRMSPPAIKQWLASLTYPRFGRGISLSSLVITTCQRAC